MSEDYIESFVRYLEARGASKKTVKTYLYFVREFAEFLGKPLSESTLDDVIKFMSLYKDKSVYTRWTVAYALKSLFRVVKSGVNPDLIPVPERPKERDIVVIPEEAFRTAVNMLPIKVATMVALTYELGLRCSELCQLRAGDLNLRDGVCYVRRVKGSVSGAVPIVTPWVMETLVKYLEYYKPVDPNQPLFPGRGGGFMNPASVSTILKKALAQMGYPNARPHDIRHSRATHLWRAGLDAITIARVLGHKELSSTLRYSHIVVAELREKLLKALGTR